MLSSTGGDFAVSLAATNAANVAKNNIEREKVMNERQKIVNDAKAQQLKAATDVYKADTQYKIAKANKINMIKIIFSKMCFVSMCRYCS